MDFELYLQTVTFATPHKKIPGYVKSGDRGDHNSFEIMRSPKTSARSAMKRLRYKMSIVEHLLFYRKIWYPTNRCLEITSQTPIFAEWKHNEFSVLYN